MKLSEIKTEKDFWEFSDVWYQRTLSLAQIAFHTDCEESKKNKAFRLWFQMYCRMLVLFEVAKDISLRTAVKFSTGGVPAKINRK